MADGRPAPMVASALSSSKRVGHRGAVVAGEPDLVHAVVESDDAVIGHHRAYVGDNSLRRQREAGLVRTGHHPRQDAARIGNRADAFGS